jgi:lipoprotein-anchoring transpeptidase ErfK/SrfK
LIPTDSYTSTLQTEIARTRIDINVPEYKLRIIVGNDTMYTYSVRVGQNRDRFLSEAGRERDLRTRVGKGRIVEVRMNSSIIEPTESKKVTTTLRDDGKRTKMPLQPWIETEINGERMGQLIHPTTNPKTLGAAYSNGCIGTKESDIWRIYYYAPIGTPVEVRYDLEVKDETGKTQKLKDIYKRELSHDLGGDW